MAQASFRTASHGDFPRRSSARAAALRVLACLGCLAGSAACLSTAPTTQQPLGTNGAIAVPEAVRIYEEHCGSCHVLSTIKRYEKSPRQWERTIDRMRLLGVEISDEEKAVLRDYLSPPAKP